MTGLTKQNILKLLLVAGLIVVLDQITKAVILDTLPLHEDIAVLTGFFNITHVQNPGGAFGIFASFNSNFRHLFFVGVAFMALGLVFYFYISTPPTHPVLSVGFAFIFGGAIGNLIDRIRFGQVVDFLDFYIGQWHWPAFNVADSAISVGIGIFLFHILFKKVPML
jgi:signal peptidase II